MWEVSEVVYVGVGVFVGCFYVFSIVLKISFPTHTSVAVCSSFIAFCGMSVTTDVTLFLCLRAVLGCTYVLEFMRHNHRLKYRPSLVYPLLL